LFWILFCLFDGCCSSIWGVRHLPFYDVALSSAPRERLQPFALVLSQKGSECGIDAEDLERNLQCSRNTALRTMKTLKLLGLVDLDKQTRMTARGDHQECWVMKLKSEFKWFQSCEFDQLWRQKVPYEEKPAEAPQEPILETWDSLKSEPTPTSPTETRPAENKEA
jgi:hypothetical protein